MKHEKVTERPLTACEESPEEPLPAEPSLRERETGSQRCLVRVDLEQDQLRCLHLVTCHADAHDDCTLHFGNRENDLLHGVALQREEERERLVRTLEDTRTLLGEAQHDNDMLRALVVLSLALYH